MISHSKLSAEASAFNVWQLSEEQLFIQLQDINTSMQNIKYHSEHIIAPQLVEINTSLLSYHTSPQLLSLPQNHLLNIQLQQQRFNLQQQFVQNQQTYQQLQQQLKATQVLYHKIKNDPNRYEQPYSEQIVEQKEEETVETMETTADIPLESQSSLRSPSPSASIYTESTISHIPPSETKSLTHNKGEIRYDVKSLIEFQSDFLCIDWKKHKNIPLCMRFISKGINNEKYMQDVVAMFLRKASNPWLAPSHIGSQPVDNLDRLQKKLRGILNKMTPDKFGKIAAQTMNVMEAFDETQDRMRVTIDTILQFVIEIPVFADQYARLCRYLYDGLQINDDNLRKKFRQMVILQTNDLFKKHRKYSLDDNELDVDDAEELEIKRIKLKKNFFAVMTLVAELYNVDLINVSVIYKGLFDILLPPNNKQFTVIDIEGLCCLLRQCGKKLDANGGKKYVSKYLQKLSSHAKKFDFRTQVIVDEIKEMRNNEWKQRIKKEVARTKEEIRNEFETNYAKTHPHQYNKREYHDNDRYHASHRRKRHNNRYSSRRNRYKQAAKSTSSSCSSYGRRPVIYNDNESCGNESHSTEISNNGADTQQSLRSLVDEYLISGAIDDILCYKFDDFMIWAQLINDGLRDRKSTEMERFIALIIQLFEHNVLHNKCAVFINVIVEYLAMQLDDSSIDCPIIIQYIAQLFAQLCYYQYLYVDDVYDYFVQKYMQHSQYLLSAKTKNINQLIKCSIEKLKQLQASQRLIVEINKYSM